MFDGQVEIVNSEDGTDSAFDSEQRLLTSRDCDQMGVCLSSLGGEDWAISATGCRESSGSAPPSPRIASDVAEAETQKAFSISDLRTVEEASQEFVDSSIGPFAFRAVGESPLGACGDATPEARLRRLSVVTIEDSLPATSPPPLGRRLEIDLCETAEPCAEATPGDAENLPAEQRETICGWRAEDTETLQPDLPRPRRRKRRIRCQLKTTAKAFGHARLAGRAANAVAEQAAHGLGTSSRDATEAAVRRRPKRRRQMPPAQPAKDELPSLALDTRELSQWASMAQVVPTQERLETDEFTGLFRQRLRFARQRDMVRKRVA